VVEHVDQRSMGACIIARAMVGQPPCAITTTWSACRAMLISCNTLTTVVPCATKARTTSRRVGLVRRVQVGSRFIHQQYLGLHRQCPCNSTL